MADIKKFFLTDEPNGIVPELIDPQRKSEIKGIITNLATELDQDPIMNLGALLSQAESSKLVTNDEANLYYMYTFASLINQGIFKE